MTSKPYITLPATDIVIQFPMTLFDGDVRISFANEAVIDSAIKQLVALKETIKEEGATAVCGL